MEMYKIRQCSFSLYKKIGLVVFQLMQNLLK